MKKMFMAAFVLTSFTLVGQETATATVKSTSLPAKNVQPRAQSPTTAPAESPEWDFVQIGVWFGVPKQTNNTDVYGIKIGVPFCGGKKKVAGLETAVLCGATDRIEGAQACIITSISKKVVGFQGSIVNFCDDVEGLQFGIINFAKNRAFQLGILNFIDNSSVPFFPIVNFRFP